MPLQTNNAWPASLPLPFVDFSGAPVSGSIASPEESPKIFRRRRFALAYHTLSVKWHFTQTQLDEFKIFHASNLGCGVAAFEIDLRFPKTSVLTTWQVRLLGEIDASYEDGMWEVNATLFLLHPKVLIVQPDVPVVVDVPVGGGGGGGGSPTYNPDNPGAPLVPISCEGGGGLQSMISNYVWFMGSEVNPNDVLGSAIAVHQELFENELDDMLAGLTIHSSGELYWYWASASGSYKSAYFKTGFPSTDPNSPDGDVYITSSGGGWWALAKDYCVS